MMTPEMFMRIGVAIFGMEEWQNGFCKALQVSNRTVQRWAAGALPMPEGLYEDLIELLGARRERARRMRDEERVAAISAMLTELLGEEKPTRVH